MSLREFWAISIAVCFWKPHRNKNEYLALCILLPVWEFYVTTLSPAVHKMWVYMLYASAIVIADYIYFVSGACLVLVIAVAVSQLLQVIQLSVAVSLLKVWRWPSSLSFFCCSFFLQCKGLRILVSCVVSFLFCFLDRLLVVLFWCVFFLDRSLLLCFSWHSKR